MARISIEQIQEELSKENWSLVSTDYKNLNSELIAKCPEGHLVYTSWGKLRTKRDCPVCKQNKYKENTPIVKEKKKGKTRILALDQATKITGYALFDGAELVHYGIFNINDEDDETARIHQIKMWLLSIIENYKPDIIGIEGIQYEANFGVTTFQTLARLQGVVMDLCFELDIPFKLCPTNTWRAHNGVKGKSRQDKKKSMQLIIKNTYDVSVSDDEADAIGIGKYVAENMASQQEIINWE